MNWMDAGREQLKPVLNTSLKKLMKITKHLINDSQHLECDLIQEHYEYGKCILTNTLQIK